MNSDTSLLATVRYDKLMTLCRNGKLPFSAIQSNGSIIPAFCRRQWGRKLLMWPGLFRIGFECTYLVLTTKRTLSCWIHKKLRCCQPNYRLRISGMVQNCLLLAPSVQFDLMDQNQTIILNFRLEAGIIHIRIQSVHCYLSWHHLRLTYEVYITCTTRFEMPGAFRPQK